VSLTLVFFLTSDPSLCLAGPHYFFQSSPGKTPFIMIASHGIAAARRAAASSSLVDARLSALVAPPHRRQLPYQQSSSSFSTNPARKNVVVVDGVRLPFAMTTTIYEDQLAVDLQRLAYQGLITKTALDKGDVDYLIAGTVIQEVRTSNIAREAAINAGFPASIGAHTVAMVRSMILSVAAAEKNRSS
jgi:hypothetical protein